MKKLFVILSLVVLVLAGCQSLPTQVATQAPISNTATAVSSTPTADFTGKLFPGGADLFGGPGEVYPKVGSATDSVKILGQAYGCTWFQVLWPTGNLTGWLSADKIFYSIKCADIPGVQVPPTPQPTATFTLFPSATFTIVPSATFTLVPTKPNVSQPAANSCYAGSGMTIGNRTGAAATFKLVGPGTFFITLPPDKNTSIKVCEGCYDVYTIGGGCGDAFGSKVFKLCDGFNGWIYCNK